MTKSTITTSRKIHAMELSFKMLAFLTLVYCIASYLIPEFKGEIVFAAAIGAIGGIVGSLNIANGMQNNNPE